MSVRQRLLHYLRTRLGDEAPALRLVFWDGDRFDFAQAPRVTITLHSPAPVKSLLRGNFARLGDAYVAGDLTVDGAIEDVLRVGVTLAERLGRSSAARYLGRGARLVSRRHSRQKDAADVGYHYDVSNDFYRLWLDENMVYSCAYFRDGAEDIHAAQRQKLDHICRKLLLKPGERLLDIGCGWGGLLIWAVQHYGVSGVGITLSRRQYDYARDRVAASGLSEKIEIRLQDYRELAGEESAFDKVASVGMYEHVGAANYPIYFNIIAALLRPGGALLNHGIVATDPRGRAQGPPGGEFIDRYVFPGGSVPHLSRVVFEVAKAGLELADIEDLRPHYARTLLHWVRRLEAHRDEAMRTAGAERYRIWRVYLAGMAYAFDRGWLSIAQTLAFKRGAGGALARPWTRDYQYVADAQPVLAGALDWNARHTT
ncbi:MAG TPA: cyclopropane-fatty-acyl-phospholipid synthase family protein [Pseudolabrys sp.]|nr:cyclopropane-fatty-acyl-phospholipid synthase family protein [Pseudolabrys sp.]